MAASLEEQRREARLAREAAMAANGMARRSGHPGQGQRDPLTDRRRVTYERQRVSNGAPPPEGEYGDRPTRPKRRQMEHLERLDVLGEFTVHVKQPRAKFNRRRDPSSRPSGSAHAASPGTTARVRHRSPNAQPTRAAKPPITSPVNANAKSEDEDSFFLLNAEDEQDEAEGYEEDEVYEEDEEYEEDEAYDENEDYDEENEDYDEEDEDEEYRAELNDPEHLPADLADVFGPKWTPMELVDALKVQSDDWSAPALTRHRTQYIIETLGGDYMRYSPGAASVSLTHPEKTDAVTQAQLVLSKIKMIDLNQRQTLLGIVDSATGKQSKALKRV